MREGLSLVKSNASEPQPNVRLGDKRVSVRFEALPFCFEGPCGTKPLGGVNAPYCNC